MKKESIRKVELVSNGLKGLKVEYKTPYTVKDRNFVRDHKEGPKHPTHLAIDNHFNELTHPLLDIYGILDGKSKKEIDYEMSQTKVTEVSFDGLKFRLKGTKEVVGEMPVPLVTPWIDEDSEYEGYEGTVAIINHLFEEVVFYMSGDVKVTNDEIAVKIVTNDKKRGITKADLDAMLDEDRKNLLSSVLEEVYGASVFFPEDVVQGSDSDDPAINVDFIKKEIPPEDLESGINLGDKEEIVLPA